MIAFYRVYALPWELGLEQDDDFRELLKRVVIGVFVLAVVFSFLPVPEIDRAEIEEVPPRFAKLLLDKPKPPPPPPVVKKEPEKPKPEPDKPKPVEKKVVEVKPDPKPKIDKTEQARKKAAMAGLLPFADELADLRDNEAVASVANKRNLAGAAGAAARSERSMITSSAGRASSGINTASMSRDTGGAGLVGRDTTTVSSTVAGLDAQRPEAERSGDPDRPARSREEIEMVFDKNKGAIYALYNRALRRDPSLQGKLVLRLTIEPSGAVSMCEVVSSELEDDELQRKLVQRVKLFRFVDKDVAPVTTTKPIDFFPA
ncbi:MAG: AgmX/PglI C-terminal domain-containing protein [Gammaproteobacteria bacterium]|nr:AgmX/PglI C-terminal domain-containing protein [Gammaproteobacteria bacterium]